MKKQLKLFDTAIPTNQIDMIKNSESYLLGMKLADLHECNKVQALLEIFKVHINEEIDTNEWAAYQYYNYDYYTIIYFSFCSKIWTLEEQKSTKINLRCFDSKKTYLDVVVFEWEDNSFDPVNLFNCTEKEIKKNRQYIDAVLKNKA